MTLGFSKQPSSIDQSNLPTAVSSREPARHTPTPPSFGDRVRRSSTPPSFGEPARHTPTPPSFGDRVRRSSTPPSFGEPARHTPTPPSFGDRVRRSSTPPSFGDPCHTTPSFGDPARHTPTGDSHSSMPPSFEEPAHGPSSRTTPLFFRDPIRRPSTQTTPSFGEPVRQTPSPPSFGYPARRSSTPPLFGVPAHGPSASPSFGNPVRLSTPPSFGESTHHPSTPSSFGEPALRLPTLPFSRSGQCISSFSGSHSHTLGLYSFHEPAPFSLGSASVPAVTKPGSRPSIPHSPRQLQHLHICACPYPGRRRLRHTFSKPGYKTLPMACLGVRENEARSTPQSSQMVPQIGDSGVQILINTNDAMLRLPGSLSYSQAAATYGSQMEGFAISRERFDHVLESMVAQSVTLQSLVRDLL